MRERVRALIVGLILLVTPSALAQDHSAHNRLDVQLVRPVTERNLDVADPVFSAAGQLTRVHLQVTNTASRGRTLEYEFEWFDAAGVPRQTLVATQTLFLDRGETQTLLSVGQHANAVNARVTIRERRN